MISQRHRPGDTPSFGPGPDCRTNKWCLEWCPFDDDAHWRDWVLVNEVVLTSFPAPVSCDVSTGSSEIPDAWSGWLPMSG